MINICKKFKADIYLSGKGGAKYQEEKKFEINKIKLEYIDFIHPVYVQSWKEFIKGLSIIDLLFNYGPSSLEVLLGNNQS